MNTISLVMYQN